MQQLRIGIGRFWHESNTFSPVPATIEDFVSYGGIAVGAEVLEYRDRHDEVAGFVGILDQKAGVEVVPLLSAGALPSGPVAQEAVDFLGHALRMRLREAGPLDGVCLALHGAMSGVNIEDLDGYFLRVVREEVGAEVPIVCPIDCHAIVTNEMVELSTALVAYRTHPHVDLVETGMRAARILLDTVAGRAKPVVRFRKIPLMVPPSDEGTHGGALKDLFDAVGAWDEIEGVIACSLCPGYAWQDVAEQGWTALAVTNGDSSLADRLSRELAERCWDVRHRLLPDPMLAPEQAIRSAAVAQGSPIVITDSADTIGAGAPGDNTVLLESLVRMRGDIEGLILCHIPDGEAVSAVRASTIGSTVEVTVGGKRDTRYCRPLTVCGKVLAVTDGRISDDGHFTSEPMIDVGTVVCVGIDNIRLVLSERPVLGPQPSLFRKVGIEPFHAKIVALKTGIGYKTTYGSAAKAVFRVDCPGAASYNLRNFEFKKIPRPMFLAEV